MTAIELQHQIERLATGYELPGRVVVGASGLAVSWHKAHADFAVIPALCFIRDDGSTLAAPVSLAGVAWSLWSDRWVALVPLPKGSPTMSHAN